MAVGDRKDPVLAFQFRVEIDGLVRGAFSEVGGLQMEVEVEDYREGGNNGYIHRLAGPARFPSNLTLKHGIADDDELWLWYRDVMNDKITRRKVSILLLDAGGAERRRWTFKEAYPVKWVGPDLRGNTAEVAVETLELVHRGLEE
jgi:phage tail-like protein